MNSPHLIVSALKGLSICPQVSTKSFPGVWCNLESPCFLFFTVASGLFVFYSERKALVLKLFTPVLEWTSTRTVLQSVTFYTNPLQWNVVTLCLQLSQNVICQRNNLVNRVWVGLIRAEIISVPIFATPSFQCSQCGSAIYNRVYRHPHVSSHCSLTVCGFPCTLEEPLL